MNKLTEAEIAEFHRINLTSPLFVKLVENPELIGLDRLNYEKCSIKQKAELVIGEYLYNLWKIIGVRASELLFNGQWGYETPEWYDHRHHIMNPEKWFTDYWTESADNVLRALPLGGKMLNLCSGDGFYDYYFFRKRAGEVVCIEFDHVVFKHALRLHSAPNIKYILDSVLTYSPEETYFDVVLIRGAIEHFSRTEQQMIIAKAYSALKPGGYFCGDTPLKAESGKHLPMHVFEWSGVDEAKAEIGTIFPTVEVRQYASSDITNLFWMARKE